MTLKQKLKNPFVQQSILEILLPIVGYFFFDWSLTIIAVFYLLDQFASELLFLRRLHWIQTKGSNQSKIPVLLLAIIFFSLFYGIELIVGSYFWIEFNLNQLGVLKAELLSFAKEELWILFPLIIYMYHLKDKFTFYMPRRYMNYDANKTFKMNVLSLLIVVLLVLTGLFVLNHINLNEITILFSFIGAKILFDFLFIPWKNKKSLKL